MILSKYYSLGFMLKSLRVGGLQDFSVSLRLLGFGILGFWL